MVAPVSLYAFCGQSRTWCTHTLKHPPLHLCCAAGSGTLHALSEANKAQDTWCASSSSSYTHHSPSSLTTPAKKGNGLG